MKPSTAINPEKSCASAKASGTIVSTTIARIAPAAIASMEAITVDCSGASKRQPSAEAMAEASAIANQRARIAAGRWPAFFIPVALARPSGTLDRNTATTATRLTPLPGSRLTPITTASGMPSRSAPSASENPLLPSALIAWPARLRCFAPTLVSRKLPAVKISAPPTNPPAVEKKPSRSQAFSTNSNESAEISTPAPKAITAAISRGGGLRSERRCSQGRARSQPTHPSRQPGAKAVHCPCWVDKPTPSECNGAHEKGTILSICT